MSEKIVCPKCGKKNSMLDGYCIKCGSYLFASAEEIKLTDDLVETVETKKNEVNKKVTPSKKKSHVPEAIGISFFFMLWNGIVLFALIVAAPLVGAPLYVMCSIMLIFGIIFWIVAVRSVLKEGISINNRGYLGSLISEKRTEDKLQVRPQSSSELEEDIDEVKTLEVIFKATNHIPLNVDLVDLIYLYSKDDKLEFTDIEERISIPQTEILLSFYSETEFKKFSKELSMFLNSDVYSLTRL